LCLLPSCAAAFGTGPFLVPISSAPPGATVRYRNNEVGVTPCTITMQNDLQTVHLSLPGHHRHEVDVGTVDNAGWVLAGFLIWGPFELIWDAAAGAFTRTNDAAVHIVLRPTDQSAPLKWERPDSSRRPKKGFANRLPE